MSAVADVYPGWASFWHDLDFQEIPWERKLDSEEHKSFEAIVECMVNASVPAEPMAMLRQSWSPLQVHHLFFGEDFDLRQNLQYAFMQPHTDVTETAAKVLEELQLASGKEHTVNWDTVKSSLPQFLNDLRSCAFLTVWQLMDTFAAYTATLPWEVFNELRRELYPLAVIHLLCQLR